MKNLKKKLNIWNMHIFEYYQCVSPPGRALYARIYTITNRIRDRMFETL